MALKIEAAKRLVADAESWFDSLTKEQKKEYLELHPNSKYAGDTGGDAKPAPKETHTDALKRIREKHGLGDVDTMRKDHKDSGAAPGTLHETIKNKQDNAQKEWESSRPMPVKLAKEVKHAIHSEEAHPGSKMRRTWGETIKAKGKGIVKHLFEEVKEAGVAGHAVTKLLRGKKLSDKEKHAMKATAIRMVLVVGSMAAGGVLATALGEGVKHVAQEIAQDFLKHGFTNAAEKTLMHSSTESPSGAEGLTSMTEMLADYMANSPNVQKILEKASGG